MTAFGVRQDFYVIGGTLQRDAPSYVQRRADLELFERLNEGRFCYVLTSRQIGKSSLMVRAAVKLRDEGAAVAVLDLTALGLNLSAEQWYDGLLGRVGQQLGLRNSEILAPLVHDEGVIDRQAVDLVRPRRAKRR